MTLPIMPDAIADAVINAPVEAIDLTGWVLGLTDKEYQACSKDHIAAGATVSPDGKPMPINVERIGRLIVQHYVADISERRHCRLVRSATPLARMSAIAASWKCCGSSSSSQSMPLRPNSPTMFG